MRKWLWRKSRTLNQCDLFNFSNGRHSGHKPPWNANSITQDGSLAHVFIGPMLFDKVYWSLWNLRSNVSISCSGSFRIAALTRKFNVHVNKSNCRSGVDESASAASSSFRGDPLRSDRGATNHRKFHPQLLWCTKFYIPSMLTNTWTRYKE
jgi:hypothetical protein